jgi:hypothetical protein
MPPVMGAWAATVQSGSSRAVAAQIRRSLGDAPIVVLGTTESLSLCFELRRPIPAIETPEQAIELARRRPELVLLSIGKDRRAAAPVPEGFRRVLTLQRDDQVFRFFRLVRSEPAGP